MTCREEKIGNHIRIQKGLQFARFPHRRNMVIKAVESRTKKVDQRVFCRNNPKMLGWPVVTVISLVYRNSKKLQEIIQRTLDGKRFIVLGFNE